MKVVTLRCSKCNKDFDHTLRRGRLPSICTECKNASKVSTAKVRLVTCKTESCDNTFVIIGKGNKRYCDTCSERTPQRSITVRHATCSDCGNPFEFVGGPPHRKRCDKCIEKHRRAVIKARDDRKTEREIRQQARKNEIKSVRYITVSCEACGNDFELELRRGRRTKVCPSCKENNVPKPKGYRVVDEHLIDSLNLPITTTAIALNTQQELRAKANRRVENLEIMLRAIGAHISQHR